MRTSPASPQRPFGVSLIELMVGMVIGLLATLVIAQVAKVFEGNKRSATSGSDAQVNGALALDALQRDLAMSGYGLTSGGMQGCSQIRSRHSTSGIRPNMTLAPVFITDGTNSANGYSDTLETLISSTIAVSVPIPVTGDHRRDSNTFVIDPSTNFGLQQGALMLAVPTVSASASTQVTPNWCSLFNLSATPVAGSNTLQHDPGTNGPWNQSVTDTVFPGTNNADISYAAGSYLVPLGQLISRVYSVSTANNPTLQLQTNITQTLASSTDELFPQIVNLQAVYGKDTNADRYADTWNATVPANANEWTQVIAVRVAIVARTAQFERCDPTSSDPQQKCPTLAAPTWKPDGVNSVTLNISYLSNWQHYRYRVFETVVPLRNMLWNAPPPP